MRLFGLIGYPLSHSFSPGYFNDKFKQNNLHNCLYKAFPIETIFSLKHLINANPNLEGLNVTIPYKKEVLPYLDEQSEAVKSIGACNCIKIKDGKLTGYNTDVIGFENSLKPYLASHHNTALILGTGGAAAAVQYVLDKLEIDYDFVSRKSIGDTGTLSYSQLNKELIQSHKLIINTTPLGMYPAVDDCPAIPYEYLTSDHYLFDLIYNPGKTLFLRKGEESGATIKNGAKMLEIQAEESWRIWNEK